MKYYVINAEKAMEYKGFILPHVIEMVEAMEFTYICAIAVDGVVGLAVIDPLETVAELLSISVSPAFQHRGVASGLLNKACEVLSDVGISFLSVRYAMTEDKWTDLEKWLKANAFVQSGRNDGFYTFPLKKIAESKILQAAMKRKASAGIMPLRDVPDVILKVFSYKVVDSGLFAPIRKNEYHPELSFIYQENGVIMACFLIKELGPDVLENSWTYLSPNVKNKNILLELFAQSAVKGCSLYPENTEVGFACLTETSEKILCKIIPELNRDSVQEYFIRSTDSGIAREVMTQEDKAFAEGLEAWKKELPEDSGEPPEVKFELVTDDGLVCERCAHQTDKLVSCKKYKSKPGTVMYGGDCPLFEAK